MLMIKFKQLILVKTVNNIFCDLYKEEQSDVKFSDLIQFGKKLKRLRKNMMKLIMSCDSIDKLLS